MKSKENKLSKMIALRVSEAVFDKLESQTIQKCKESGKLLNVSDYIRSLINEDLEKTKEATVVSTENIIQEPPIV